MSRHLLPATVGPETGEARTCGYSRRLGDPVCGEPATLHAITDSAIYGVVGLVTCDAHADVARRAGATAEEHPFAGAVCEAGTCWQRTDRAPTNRAERHARRNDAD